jgi:hypothetical protein
VAEIIWLFDLQLPVQSVSAYHHKSCEFEPRSWRGVLNTTLCDTVCQWFSPVFPSNKTVRQDIAEINLKK